MGTDSRKEEDESALTSTGLLMEGLSRAKPLAAISLQSSFPNGTITLSSIQILLYPASNEQLPYPSAFKAWQLVSNALK